MTDSFYVAMVQARLTGSDDAIQAMFALDKDPQETLDICARNIPRGNFDQLIPIRDGYLTLLQKGG